MFDWAATVQGRKEPFPWVSISDLLPLSAANQLFNCNPVGLRTSIREHGSDKTYAVRNARVFPLALGYRLSGVWGEFVHEIRSGAYLDFIEGACGVRLAGCYIQVEVNEYRAGGHMSPHTDRHPKLVTHILYLNESWFSHWGGALELMESSDARPTECIVPSWPISVLLVRSDRSWHAVQPLAGSAPPRRTVQVTFWSTPPSDALPGRHYHE